MGNLQQEHNFQTDGDGIAQWLDGRRDRLQSNPNWQDLTVQLDFIIYELNSSESATNLQLSQSYSIEGATLAFQNGFERCNPRLCMQDQRIEYAYYWYNLYK